VITKRQAFYNSDKWQRFTKLLRMERMQPDGSIICTDCGKRIVKAYDCIAHHVIELDDNNVDDVSIALNPDNIELLCFNCHNKRHKRFGYNGKACKQVFIVYGAPCAGKTTYVKEVAQENDLVLDIDNLWAAVKAGSCKEYQKPEALKSIVFDLRDTILEDVRTRRGRWENAYIIGGYPMQGERERMQDRIGADKLVHIDTDKETCLQRAKLKAPEWERFVLDWFEKFSAGCPPVA
jgi:shikimate kinase